jgi:8-oxo-dGTP pyrophosphatase MutT (NUDIX family)
MKTRADVLAVLRVYGPDDTAEREMVQRTIEFIEANHNCCERSLKSGHLTGSAWILDETGTYALMTHHRKLDRWLQLGGHADGDFDLLAVALREAREESGLTEFRVVSSAPFDVDVHLIPARGEEPAHFHYDVCFELQAMRDAPLTVSEESHTLAWIPVQELANRHDSDESIRRKARKTLLGTFMGSGS